jgi:hypothetical protein
VVEGRVPALELNIKLQPTVAAIVLAFLLGWAA